MKWLFAALALMAFAAPPAAAQQAPRGLYGVKIVVDDFQRAINFYSQLGLRLGAKHNATEWQLDWESPAQGSCIIMVRDGGKSKRVKGGTSMLILVPEIAAAVDRLRAAGFVVTGDLHKHPQGSTMTFRDPDGNEVELSGK